MFLLYIDTKLVSTEIFSQFIVTNHFEEEFSCCLTFKLNWVEIVRQLRNFADIVRSIFLSNKSCRLCVDFKCIANNLPETWLLIDLAMKWTARLHIILRPRARTIYRDIEKIDLELVRYTYWDVRHYRSGKQNPRLVYSLFYLRIFFQFSTRQNVRFSVGKPGTIVLWKMATEATRENSWVSLNTPTIKKSTVWTHFGFPVSDNKLKKNTN